MYVYRVIIKHSQLEVHDYTQEVCGIDCSAWCNEDHCDLNVGGIIMNGDNRYMSVVASTIGKPSVVLAHGNNIETMFISAANLQSIPNFWVNAIQNQVNLEQGIKTNKPYTRTLDLLKFDGAANIVAIQLEAIFEYIDENEDGGFNAEKDTVIRVYDLDRPWKAMSSNLTSGGASENDDTGIISFSSVDGIISFTVQVSSSLEAAKVDIEINGFQPDESKTKLGLKAVLLAPSVGDQINGYRQYAQIINIASRKNNIPIGYFSWLPFASIRESPKRNFVDAVMVTYFFFLYFSYSRKRFLMYPFFTCPTCILSASEIIPTG